MFTRLVLCFVLVLPLLQAPAQTIARLTSVHPSSEPTLDQLARELTSGLFSEREKVGAIFNWITGNISYKVSSRIGNTQAWRRRLVIEDEDASIPLKPLDERVAESVLMRREAVCDGYARLFKTLCQYAGIRAEVVNGYARGSSNRGFRSNHSWNAVLIDGRWYLVDATWAAGYVGYFGDTFVRSYDARYFLAPPEQFIQDHYPEDPYWTLIPEAPAPPEFKWGPFRHSGYVRNTIIGYAPYSGVVEASLGDTLVFELETNQPGPQMEIWDRPFGDPRLHTGPIWRNYPEVPAQVMGRKVNLRYVVQTPDIRFLYVVFNGESVLQYRLQVKPSNPEALVPAP